MVCPKQANDILIDYILYLQQHIKSRGCGKWEVKSKTEEGDYKAIDKEVEQKKKEIGLAKYPEVEKELAEKLFKEPLFFAGLTAVTMMVCLDKDRAKVLIGELENKTSERTASLLIKGLKKYHNL